MALIKYVDLERLARFKENLDAIFALKKDKQTVVRDPITDGTSVSFIDTISQDTQGVITPTKKTIAMASPSNNGLMSAVDKIKIDNITVASLDNTINISDDSTGMIVQFNTPRVTYGSIDILEQSDGLAFTFAS